MNEPSPNHVVPACAVEAFRQSITAADFIWEKDASGAWSACFIPYRKIENLRAVIDELDDEIVRLRDEVDQLQARLFDCEADE